MAAHGLDEANEDAPANLHCIICQDSHLPAVRRMVLHGQAGNGSGESVDK